MPAYRVIKGERYYPLTAAEAKKLGDRDVVYDTKYTNRDGTPARWRINGAVKRWKKDPNRFSVPIKHGMYDFDHITEKNYDDYMTDSYLKKELKSRFAVIKGQRVKVKKVYDLPGLKLKKGDKGTISKAWSGSRVVVHFDGFPTGDERVIDVKDLALIKNTANSSKTPERNCIGGLCTKLNTELNTNMNC